MSLPHYSRCRAPYYDDDDEKKTAADAMKDPDDPDKDRGRSTRTPGQTMTRAEIHRAAREAMTYQEAMIPNRCCVICAKRRSSAPNGASSTPHCSSRRSRRPRLETSLSSASNMLFTSPAGLFDTGPRPKKSLDRKVHTLKLGNPPYGQPPQAGKMTPERPFPALIDTGNSSPKAGFAEKHPLYAP